MWRCCIRQQNSTGSLADVLCWYLKHSLECNKSSLCGLGLFLPPTPDLVHILALGVQVLRQ